METTQQSLNIMWVLICAALVLFMQAGFLCLETGLTRTKNNINVAIKNIADFGVSVFLHWALGFGIMFGVTQSGLFGTDHFFVNVGGDAPWLNTFFIFQAMFCGTAVTIVSGAIAERMSFKGYLIVAVVMSLLLYPLFGHWVWGGGLTGDPGWLAQIGYVDFAGSSVVHGVGAWAALGCLLVIGPRIGRFHSDGTPRTIPPSNQPMAMLGVCILWLGWIGFNGGSTLALNADVPKIVVNTVLACVAGIITSLFYQGTKNGYIEAKSAMNGSLAGLVAITAGCHSVSGHEALIIGAVGACIAIAGDDWLLRRGVDDVVSAIPVHGFAGVWGILAVALFGDLTVFDNGNTRLQQLGVQFLGAGVCFGFVFGTSWTLFTIINRFFALRVSAEDEEAGLNIAEHRAENEHYVLLKAMSEQSKSPNLNQRVPEEPFTETGQIARLYNQVLDSLQSEVTRSKSIVRDIKDGILVASQEGVIQSFNPGAESIFKIPSKDAVGTAISRILLSADGGDEINSTRILKSASGTNCSIELTARCADGSTIPVEVTVSKNADMHTDNSMYTCIIRDITERKKAEDVVLKAKNDAESARDDLNQKVNQLEDFNRHVVDRELRMIELKRHINKLSVELNQSEPYSLKEIDKAIAPMQISNRKNSS